MNLKRFIKQIVSIGGCLLLLIQLFLIISKGNISFQFFLFFLLTAFLTCISVFFLIREENEEKAKMELGKTKQILQIITQNQGKSTLATLIMKMEVPVPQLKTKLDELHKEGVLGIETSATGETLYTLSNPKTWENKYQLLD